MSDSQDAKNARRARERALATAPDATGLWNLADLKARVDAGVEVPTGAKFQFTNLRDYLDLGMGGGGSPVEAQGLEEWLAANGKTVQQFQQEHGGLPLIFNPDGTVSYDPSAQRTAFEYTPSSYARNQMIGMALFAAMAGAGLAGVGQGATVAGTGTGAGTTAANAFGGMDALLGGTTAASEFSLAAPGVGLNGASAGLGLNTAGLGMTPGLTAAGGGAAAMGLPTGVGLSLGTGAIADTATALAGMGGVTLDAVPATVAGPASGINPMASQAAKTVAEKTIGNSLTDAAGKVVTNLATGAITNAIAGDGGKTSSAGINQAQANLNAAMGKLPTEEEAASQAHADVTQAFQTQRDNFRRQLMGYGLDPTSGRYQGTMRKLQGQEAKTDALGQNLARRGVRSAALGEAATIANINAGLTNAQAVLDANNFARQQAVQAQVRAGLAPVVSAVAPGVSKTVSNWFDLAKNGISDWSNSFDTSLVGS